ncbi:MAG TPA: GntR family transcriptional regulator [Microbacterium sp.]|uniref:GntR family transcriptional regulator n=1 Tax=Microbacterium sp. TaxID=51671 RepID=UPI002CA17F18|nr:GntR family transcriptional regulator [Microbacterium sp.]HWI30593.1 GntR family transcriptional regulator [Microbacterium sp.]
MVQPLAMSLHEQVRNTLLFEIETGAFGAGRLPPEPELCERFGVSRITVRRAVADLAEMGMVTRRQGRGTFVSAPRSPVGTMAMGGFSDHLSGGGVMARRIMRAEVREGDADIARALRVAEGSPVFRLVRVFSLDGVPLSIDDSSYSLTRYPGFDALVDDTTSTYQLLRERYGVHFHEVERRISVSFTTEQTAVWLDRPEHDALVLIEKTATDRSGDIIHVSRVETVPSRLELKVTASED